MHGVKSRGKLVKFLPVESYEAHLIPSARNSDSASMYWRKLIRDSMHRVLLAAGHIGTPCLAQEHTPDIEWKQMFKINHIVCTYCSGTVSYTLSVNRGNSSDIQFLVNSQMPPKGQPCKQAFLRRVVSGLLLTQSSIGFPFHYFLFVLMIFFSQFMISLLESFQSKF